MNLPALVSARALIEALRSQVSKPDPNVNLIISKLHDPLLAVMSLYLSNIQLHAEAKREYSRDSKRLANHMMNLDGSLIAALRELRSRNKDGYEWVMSAIKNMLHLPDPASLPLFEAHSSE